LEFLESLLPLWRILEEGEHPMNKPEGVANPGAPLGNILESQVEAVIPAVDIHRPWEVLLQDGLDPSMFARHVGRAIIRLPPEVLPFQIEPYHAILDDGRKCFSSGRGRGIKSHESLLDGEIFFDVPEGDGHLLNSRHVLRLVADNGNEARKAIRNLGSYVDKNF